MYKDLKQVIKKPFKEIENNGGITKISEKTFAKIGKLIGGFIEYVALPSVAIILLPPALILDYLIKDSPSQIKTNGLEDKLFKIKKTGNLENLPFGVKEDIDLLLKLPIQFTEEDLNRCFENGKRKFHPDKLSGNNERWNELNSLYEELLWHYFKPTNNEEEAKLANGNYPKLREKSYRFTPKYQVGQKVRFDNGQIATIAKTNSCSLDGYFLVNSSGQYFEQVKEVDIQEVIKD